MCEPQKLGVSSAVVNCHGLRRPAAAASVLTSKHGTAAVHTETKQPLLFCADAPLKPTELCRSVLIR